MEAVVVLQITRPWLSDTARRPACAMRSHLALCGCKGGVRWAEAPLM